MVRSDQELRIEHRALGVGALRSVGELRQVAFPGGDRFGKFLLALKDRADLERRVHRKLGPIAAGFRRLELSQLLLQELGERFQGFVALAAGQVRHRDLVRGSNGFGMARVLRQESPQRRDALVQAGVVRRIGNPIGRGDREKRVRPDRPDSRR